MLASLKMFLSNGTKPHLKETLIAVTGLAALRKAS
jgi:hypothetical protein